MLFLAVWEEKRFFIFVLQKIQDFSSLAPFCNEHFFVVVVGKKKHTKPNKKQPGKLELFTLKQQMDSWFGPTGNGKDLYVNSGEHSSLAPQPLLAKPLWLLHLPVSKWAQDLGAMARLLLLIINPGAPGIVIQWYLWCLWADFSCSCMGILFPGVSSLLLFFLCDIQILVVTLMLKFLPISRKMSPGHDSGDAGGAKTGVGLQQEHTSSCLNGKLVKQNDKIASDCSKWSLSYAGPS